MAEIIETIAGLLWITLCVVCYVKLREYNKRLDKIIQELEDEFHG